MDGGMGASEMVDAGGEHGNDGMADKIRLICGL